MSNVTAGALNEIIRCAHPFLIIWRPSIVKMKYSDRPSLTTLGGTFIAGISAGAAAAGAAGSARASDSSICRIMA